MKTWFFVSIVGVALITGACTSTFLVKHGAGLGQAGMNRIKKRLLGDLPL